MGSTCSWSGRSLLIVILSWYNIKETLETIDTLLDEALLREWDLSLMSLKLLTLLTSISIAEGKEGIQEIEVVKTEEIKYIL